MLSDEVIEKVVERLARRMEQGNEYVIKKIGESIKKIGTLSPSKAQELVQTMKYGGDYDKIVKRLAEITELNVKDIKKIFREVAKSEYEFAKQFYNYRNIKYIPWDKNIELQRYVNTIADITANEYVNLTKTTAVAFGWQNRNGTITYKGLRKAYYDLLDEAILNITQGKESFDSAMYRQLKEIGGGGIKVIFPSTYLGKDEHGNKILKNRVMRADSAVRMQLKGAIRDFHNDLQEKFGKQYGADGVEISVHLNPAPDHEEAQGRQFTKKQYEKLQEDGMAKDYTDKEIDLHRQLKDGTSRIDFRPISEYNCYHKEFSIVLGVNKPNYTDEQLQQIIDDNKTGFDFEGKHYTNYEGTQLQRKLELEIRKAKDEQIVGRSSGNEKLIYESQQKITILNDKYKKLSKASKLPTSPKRMRVSGYKRVAITQ